MFSSMQACSKLHTYVIVIMFVGNAQNLQAGEWKERSSMYISVLLPYMSVILAIDMQLVSKTSDQIRSMKKKKQLTTSQQEKIAQVNSYRITL